MDQLYSLEGGKCFKVLDFQDKNDSLKIKFVDTLERLQLDVEMVERILAAQKDI